MKKQMRILLFAAAFGGFCPAPARGDLTKTINSVLAHRSQKKVVFGVHIVEARTGRTVYAHNAGKAMTPASNVKVVVSAAALKYLGPGYEYVTQVVLFGETLIIIGAGDPLLGDRGANQLFDDITAALKKKGISRIKDIVVDSSVFDDNRVHPNWPRDELNRPYACEVSGLNYNGNCVKITATRTGNEVALAVEPETKYVEMTNKVRAVSKGSSAVGSYRSTEANKITVYGKCRKQASFDVAIERPAAFFGCLLAEHLSKAGLKITGQFIEKAIGREKRYKLISQYRTSITDVLARCNKDSFGLAAEALVKTIAGAPNGSWQGGREKISQYLLSLGIEQDRFYIDDGSGLSSSNKLSADAITKVLLDVYKSDNWKMYKDSLAAGGANGTLRKHFKDKKYRGRIFGKTGYIKGVKSLSGVCTTPKGDFLFSILANNANAKTRTAINDIAKAVIDNNQ